MVASPFKSIKKSQKHIHKIKSLEKLCGGDACKENISELAVNIDSKTNHQS